MSRQALRQACPGQHPGSTQSVRPHQQAITQLSLATHTSPWPYNIYVTIFRRGPAVQAGPATSSLTLPLSSQLMCYNQHWRTLTWNKKKDFLGTYIIMSDIYCYLTHAFIRANETYGFLWRYRPTCILHISTTCIPSFWWSRIKDIYLYCND